MYQNTSRLQGVTSNRPVTSHNHDYQLRRLETTSNRVGKTMSINEMIRTPSSQALSNATESQEKV